MAGHRYLALLAAGIAVLQADPAISRGTQDQAKGSSTQEPPPQAAATAPPPISAGPKIDSGCLRGVDKRESDLCAQWKAADSASNAARWGWWQLIIGGVGLILGAITMGAAIAAAIYAKRAARATEKTVEISESGAAGAAETLKIAERNANAAAAQVRVSEETAKRQLRAYVGIERVFVENIHIGGVPTANLHLKNFGRTPAYEYDVFSYAMIGPKDLSEEKFQLPDLAHANQSTLAPSATGHAYPSISTPWTVELDGAYRAGHLAIHVFGQVRYLDAFGEPRITDFRFYNNLSCGGSNTRLHSLGNRQT